MKHMWNTVFGIWCFDSFTHDASSWNIREMLSNGNLLHAMDKKSPWKKKEIKLYDIIATVII